MCKNLLIVCALFILTYPALAQNEIDHINTLWPSGYGKLALDGDTLYVNILNGHGVERYDVSDPANPIFIDREEVSGFDQIDFQRRLMAKIDSTQVRLVDFSNFPNDIIVYSLPLILPAMKNSNWKLDGNYMLAASADDSIRTLNIADPANVYISATIGLIRQPSPSYPSYYSVFGSTVYLVTINGAGYDHLDVYDISRPDNVHFDTTLDYFRSQTGGNGFFAAKGDTVAHSYSSFMGIQWYIQMMSFAPNDTSQLPVWGGYGEGQWPPATLYDGFDGFVIHNNYYNGQTYAYSYNDFTLLGKLSSVLNSNFGLLPDDYLLFASPNQLRIFQPVYSESFMQGVYLSELPHYGMLSSASHANYILSGAESNGGELLIHELNDANRLSLISTVPTVQAKKIIVDGSFAICLCPNKISQVGLTNPLEPRVLHELSTFSGELLDLSINDSLLFAITDRAYYVIDYDSLNGMTILSSMDFPAGSLTSIGQNQTTSVLLEGISSHLVKVSAANPIFPMVVQDWRIPADTYQNLEVMDTTVWVSSHHGTRVFNIEYLDSVAYFGPEYFSEVHDMRFSSDTLYVADGINGIKVFRFYSDPIDSLRFIGGYGTGNVINQVSTIGNNFFVSDYYSLQQLRWGAPTGIENHDTPAQPERFTLSQNYPNPFNAQTTISYNLPRESDVTLSIYNILGERIDEIETGKQTAGTHTICWNSGNLGSGLYFYRLTTTQTSITKKMVLLK